MFHIAICDDSQQYLCEYQRLLNQWPKRPDTFHVDTFDDADSLITAHRSTPYDIILLDVVMPLLNGIEAARELRQSDSNVRIIFLTSSPDFAIDAFTVQASHYLLKPISPLALYECLDRIYEDMAKSASFLTVRCNAATHRIPVANIESIEAYQKHALIALTNGTVLQAIEPLYAFEEKLLPELCFFKCHRSYIVNLYCIRTYTQKELIMQSGSRIPISRNSHKEFEASYFSLLFEDTR